MNTMKRETPGWRNKGFEVGRNKGLQIRRNKESMGWKRDARKDLTICSETEKAGYFRS